MIARVLAFAVHNRALVVLLAAMLTALGVWGYRNIRLDAIPDVSDVQVIVVTEYQGQNPTVVDDQVTYPLSNALLAVPGATHVRGLSMFELSFVYVLFADGTDLYWARSRVLEYLNFARDKLPEGVEPKLGPDATGVGWVYQYALRPGWYSPRHPQGLLHDADQGRWYATAEAAPAERRGLLRRVRAFDAPGRCPVSGVELVRAGHDLAQLRTIQDYQLRPPLTAVEGVSEVAAIGGHVRQYQVVLDPDRMRGLGLTADGIAGAIRRSNQDLGGSVVERGEQELLVRSRGYLRGLADLELVPVGVGRDGTPVLLRDVATLQVGSAARRGVGELDGEGEAVGGIVVARFGVNAWQVIRDVKAKLAELEGNLPPGVEIRTTYDRSALIGRAVDTLRSAVFEQLLVTAGICLAFLLHVRSALVALLVLPIGLLVSILVMQLLGINANIMSLGGLALAIGVMVDSGVVMVENAHRHLQRQREAEARGAPHRGQVEVVLAAAQEVGPSLFFSLLVITVAFLPIFALGGEEGRLFAPLAWTKTFAIVAGALLGITVVPVLMVYLVRGRIPADERNPLNRWSERLYEPMFKLCLRHPLVTLAFTLLLGASTLYPLSRIGSEFMPPLEEGDLLYMPTVPPSISVLKSRELLQQTDRMIRTFPEVRSVHGKIGRADTATDPAPLSMVETVIQLEPDKARWRRRSEPRFHDGWPEFLRAPAAWLFPGTRPITVAELVNGWTDADGTQHPGLDGSVRLPGVVNSWLGPIQTRGLMLATGIKTPLGIKVVGADLDVLAAEADRTAAVLRGMPGVADVAVERAVGGLYLDVDVDRAAAARFGLAVADVQDAVALAVGGRDATTTVEGLERYAVNVRYARELRDDPEALEQVLIPTPAGAQMPLGQVARLAVRSGPPMIRSEDAQRAAWVYVTLRDDDLGGFVRRAEGQLAELAPLPAGYRRAWVGTWENLQRTNERLMVLVPLTLLLIVVLLYMANRDWFRVGVILLAVPFSLIGAFWFLYALDYNLSLAVWVGVIALLGVDAETGQLMLLYLDESFARARKEGRMAGVRDLYTAIHEGAVKRLRPKSMTVATDMIGLLPLLWATGTGADVTRRLVAPLIGGITVSFLMELLVYPVIFFLAKRWRHRHEWAGQPWRVEV
ncbi:MAG: efflux RND transporter permease subunit [Planctomycetes bacterium]|nr:efflux RND transporter permease subunit [Planctomycetota bacterium]